MTVELPPEPLDPSERYTPGERLAIALGTAPGTAHPEEPDHAEAGSEDSAAS